MTLLEAVPECPQPIGRPGQPLSDGPEQTLAQGLDPGQPLGLIRHRELGSARGRGCSNIGDEIGNGEIDLVAHAGDDGNAHGGHRPGDNLLVERPEILQRTATSGQDEQVAFAAPVSQFQRRGDFRGSARTLHRSGVYQHRNRGKTPRQHRDDIAHGGATGRGHDSDSARQFRLLQLALGIEQAFRRKLALQFLESTPQQPLAHLLQVLDHQLILAPRLVNAHATARENMLTIVRPKVQHSISLSKHGATNLRGFVLHSPIQMPRRRPRKPRNLTLHPHDTQPILDHPASLPVERRHRIHLPRRLEREIKIAAAGIHARSIR